MPPWRASNQETSERLGQHIPNSIERLVIPGLTITGSSNARQHADDRTARLDPIPAQLPTRGHSSRRRRPRRRPSPPLTEPHGLLFGMDPGGASQTPETEMKKRRTLKISQSQLAEEIRGIYRGLAVVEAKCRAMAEAHVRSLIADISPPVLATTKERWPHLVALHRALLHEHHDFLPSSQYPMASLSIKNLAARHGMPGRMWRYGIHSFLELIRHYLLESYELLLELLLLAYQMLALLYETVPTFTDTWLECLGDLSRYRMAIENSDERERSSWATTSRYWYMHAHDRSPRTGRVLHYLTVLSQNHKLQQIAFYAKQLLLSIRSRLREKARRA